MERTNFDVAGAGEKRSVNGVSDFSETAFPLRK